MIPKQPLLPFIQKILQLLWDIFFPVVHKDSMNGAARTATYLYQSSPENAYAQGIFACQMSGSSHNTQGRGRRKIRRMRFDA